MWALSDAESDAVLALWERFNGRRIDARSCLVCGNEATCREVARPDRLFCRDARCVDFLADCEAFLQCGMKRGIAPRVVIDVPLYIPPEIFKEIVRRLYRDYIASLDEYRELMTLRRSSARFALIVDEVIGEITRLGQEVARMLPTRELVKFRSLVNLCTYYGSGEELHHFPRLERLVWYADPPDEPDARLCHVFPNLRVLEAGPGEYGDVFIDPTILQRTPNLESLRITTHVELLEPVSLPRLRAFEAFYLLSVHPDNLTQLTALDVAYPMRIHDPHHTLFVNLVQFSPPRMMNDEGVRNLTNLRSLCLRHNATISPGGISHLTNLTELFVGGDDGFHDAFSAALPSLTQLRRLYIYDAFNSVEGRPIEAVHLMQCTQLEALGIYYGTCFLFEEHWAALAANLQWLALDWGPRKAVNFDLLSRDEINAMLGTLVADDAFPSMAEDQRNEFVANLRHGVATVTNEMLDVIRTILNQALQAMSAYSLRNSGLRALTSLRSLYLGLDAGFITDHGLSHLTALEILSLDSSRIDGSCFPALANLRQLFLREYAFPQPAFNADALMSLSRLVCCQVNKRVDADVQLRLRERGVAVLPASWEPERDDWRPPGFRDSLHHSFHDALTREGLIGFKW